MSDEPRTILIGCAHSAGVAIERLPKALPPNVEWVSVPCGSGVDELTILRAFEAGAERVLVVACCEGACRSLEGNRWAEKRVKATRALLEEAGIEGWRLAFQQMAPSMGVDLVRWVAEPGEPVAEGGNS